MAPLRLRPRLSPSLEALGDQDWDRLNLWSSVARAFPQPEGPKFIFDA
jgi:hypothetical protein